MTIEELADQHNLTMIVTERELYRECSVHRWYAYFEDAETKDGPMLIDTYGDGGTPEEAIADYARRISGKLLVINAHQKSRREIQVPRLVYDNHGDTK